MFERAEYESAGKVACQYTISPCEVVMGCNFNVKTAYVSYSIYNASIMLKASLPVMDPRAYQNND